jgi:hypothetical protein
VVLPFSDNAMSWSGEHRGFVVETFFKNNESVIATQRAVPVVPADSGQWGGSTNPGRL